MKHLVELTKLNKIDDIISRLYYVSYKDEYAIAISEAIRMKNLQTAIYIFQNLCSCQ